MPACEESANNFRREVRKSIEEVSRHLFIPRRPLIASMLSRPNAPITYDFAGDWAT
jgi:hypothetical protein